MSLFEVALLMHDGGLVGLTVGLTVPNVNLHPAAYVGRRHLHPDPRPEGERCLPKRWGTL